MTFAGDLERVDSFSGGRNRRKLEPAEVKFFWFEWSFNFVSSEGEDLRSKQLKRAELTGRSFGCVWKWSKLLILLVFFRGAAHSGRDDLPREAKPDQELGRPEPVRHQYGAAESHDRVEQWRRIHLRGRIRRHPLIRRRRLPQLFALLQRPRNAALPDPRPLHSGISVPFQRMKDLGSQLHEPHNPLN